MNDKSKLSRKKFLQNSGVALAGSMFLPVLGKPAKGRSRSAASISESEMDQLTGLPAFPGAWGGGMYATGGRGGRVIKVTNVNNAGPGSLREAIETDGPRIVVFEVSGTINLSTDLVIENPDLTIAGQTAPGDGVCIRNGLLSIEADNVIVRYLKVRRGDQHPASDDGIDIARADTVMVDHCTVSWTTDETINTWHGTRNATFQWCVISESLHDSVVIPGHGFAASIGGENTTYHHNLLAHHAGRAPSIAGNHERSTVNLDWRNNLVYNWGHRTLDGKPDSINVVNNYYKPGPATTLNDRLVRIDNRGAYNLPVGTWYVEGNLMEGMEQFVEDNWRDLALVELEDGVAVDDARIHQPHDVKPVPTQDSYEIVDPILKHAGATLPHRDHIDHRIIEEARTGTARYGNDGIISSQELVGGWPEMRSEPAPLDSNGNGIPDWWEAKYELDSTDPDLASRDENGSGYSNIEEYINGTNPRAETDYTDPVNNRNPLQENPVAILPH